ncbi:MAG: hypothetical protein Q4F67_10310 [Propionibacteriaceae bacterium]|nr:hypothetical protein [Propionibacteriaceae bacterium]
MSDAPVGWWIALAYALTGERIDPPPGAVPSDGPPEPGQMLADLAAAGWSPARLAAARSRRQVPVAWVRELGPAQFAAAVADRVRRNQAAPQVPRVARPAPPAPARRRMADPPPPWG